MHLPATARKFIHGQQLYAALRLTLGICIPALLLMLPLQQPAAGMAAGVGALFVGLLDLPGTTAIRHRDMLLAAGTVIASALLTALALHFGWWRWLAIVGISAAGAYAGQFGPRIGMLGLNGVVVMTLTLALNGMPAAAERTFLAGLSFGALWYVYFSLAVCRLLQHQMHRRALADCLFATAAQFRARAHCYDPAIPAATSRLALLDSQTRLQLAQTLTRDLVLGELARTGPDRLDGRTLRLFNLYADLIELYDLVLAAHTDFALLKRSTDCHTMLEPLRDLLRHGADALEQIATALALNRRISRAALPATRLRDLEHAYAQWRRCRDRTDETAITLADSVHRMRDMRRLIAKTARDLHRDHNTSGLDIGEALAYYQQPSALVVRPASWWSGPAPAYALRLTLAMLLAMLAARLRGGVHDNWIVLTVAVALRPGFGLTRQRGIQRVKGTLLGCGSAVLVLMLTTAPQLIVLLTIVSLLLSLGLASIDYLLSAYFTSVMVVLLYHLLTPANAIVATRLLDTLLGALIALVMTHVYPYWEYRRIRPLSQALIDATRQFLTRLAALQPGKRIAYRAARRDMLAALANLAAARDSMRLDPPAKRLADNEVEQLLLWGHLLVSLGNTMALRRLAGDRDDQGEGVVSLAQAQLDNDRCEPVDIGRVERLHESHLVECAQQMARLNHRIQHAPTGSGAATPPGDQSGRPAASNKPSNSAELR